MLRRFLPLVVLFSFAVLGCAQRQAISAGQYRVASEEMQLDFDPQAQTAALFSTVNQLLLTSGDDGIVVWDGKLKRLRRLKLQGPIESKTGEVTFTTAGENLVARHRVYALGNVLRWDITMENQSQEQNWLEVRYAGHFRGVGQKLFYTVKEEYQPAVKEYQDETTFWPAVAIAGRGAGMWVGVDPRQLFSSLTYRFQGILGPNAGEFYFGARIVIDPGKSETVGFTFIGFTPEYGSRSALSTYYQSFPELFRAASGIDQRLLRGSSAHDITWRSASTQGEQHSPAEIPRRCAATWDWMYGPFRIPGDAFMRQDLWEMTDPTRRGDQAKSWEQIESYRKARSDYFFKTDVMYGVAPMFYTANWVHEDLVRKLYSDSPMTEDAGWEKNRGSHKNWITKRGYIKTGPWDVVEVFPWGTSAGQAFMRDYKAIIESGLNLSGFSFDSNVAAGKYRGPATSNLPGRAWDDEGVFVSEGIGQALMADYIHSLQTNGHRAAVAANQPGTHYAAAFRIDAAILEIGYGNVISTKGTLVTREYARAQSGHKPRNLYSGFHDIAGAIGLFRGWETMSPTQIRQTMEMAQDRMLIFALAYGWNLDPDMTMGDARMIRYAPVIANLNYHGWQPISAMKPAGGDQLLYLSRYGDVNRAFLCIGNDRQQRAKTQITLDAKQFGNRRAFLTDYWGVPVPMHFTGVSGKFALDLAPHDVFVLQTCVLIGGQQDIIGEARRNGDSHAGRISAEFTASQSGIAPTQIILPENMAAVSVTCNGKGINWRPNADPDTISLNLPLAAGNNTLVVDYTSVRVKSDIAAIKKFPFLDTTLTKGQCQIVVPDNAQERENGAAFRLGEYFRYWVAMHGGQPVSLPIVSESKATVLPHIFIGETNIKQPLGIVLSGGDLFIRGVNPYDTNRLLEELLSILDEQFLLVGKFENQVNYPNRLMISGEISQTLRKKDSWIPTDAGAAIEQIFRKGGFWGQELRTHVNPAGMLQPSRLIDP